MNIQDLGSIGELIAAIATLATLIYLALQIRQNTSAIRSNSRRQVLEGIAADANRFLRFGAVERFSKANRGADMTETELGELSVLFLSFMTNLELEYLEVEDGALGEDFRKSLEYRLFSCVGGSSGPRLWGMNRNFFTERFQVYVDHLMSGGFDASYEDPTWTHASN